MSTRPTSAEGAVLDALLLGDWGEATERLHEFLPGELRALQVAAEHMIDFAQRELDQR